LQQTKAPVNYPTQTRSGIHYSATGDLSKIAWWKKLHDPMLDHLLIDALATNYQIKTARANVLQAQAQLKAAQYSWIPTLDASANGFTGGTWNTNIVPSGPLANSPLFSNINNLRFRGYYAGFMPGYTVNILNNIYNVKSAKASLEAEHMQLLASKLAIISQMSGAYFMLLSQKQQLEVQKTLLKDLQEMRHLEQIRYKDGASDSEIIISMDQEIAQEAIKIPQIEQVVAQTENTIHLLLNQNPGPITTDKTLFDLNTNNLIPKNIPSSVLKNRPDIIIALDNVAIANAQVGIAYSAFFPNISLTGLVGKTSLDLTNLLKLGANFWLGQAYPSMKVLNASAYQKVKANKAGCYATYYEYLQTLRSAFKDVDDSVTNELKMRSAYRLAERSYQAAKESYNIAKTQYQQGGKDYRTVVNAKVNLDRNQLILIQEKAQLLDGSVQLYVALAGGVGV
jgi:NodT family efflux transporter outer membrane factor (OMF) lipoprotein